MRRLAQAHCYTALMLLAFSCLADPLDNWFLRSPVEIVNTFQAIEYSDRFVLAGLDGRIYTSDDATRWQLRLDSGLEVVSIFSANDKLIAAADLGTLLVSTNGGITWTFQWLNTPNLMNGIAFGNGIYVAVGNSGTVQVSADATNWSTVFFSGSNSLQSVVFSNSLFVAVGKASTIITSRDGVNWARQSSGAQGRFTQVIHDGNQFIAVSAVGEIAVSSNGTNWTLRSQGGNFNGISFRNGTYIIVGDAGMILTSKDLQTWQRQDSGTGQDLFGINYLRGSFFVLGNHGIILNSSTGTNWVGRGLDRQHFRAVGAGPTLVTGGDGGMFAIGDGSFWRLQTSQTVDSINALSYNGSQFYAVGSNSTILSSGDGQNWSTIQASLGGLRGLASTPVETVAVGDNGTILTANSAWQPQSAATTNNLYGVIFASNRFVAIGGSVVLQSSDARQWSRTDLNPTWFLRAIAFGQNRFVAVGQNGLVLASTNAIDWVSGRSGTTNDLVAIAFGNGIFVAVGAGGEVISSEDGTNWMQRPRITAAALEAIIYANRTFVAVGDQGVTLQSGNESVPSLAIRRAGDALQILATGEIGRPSHLQTSIDLPVWSDWIAFSNATRSTIFSDSSITNSPRRFFKIISP